MKNNYFQTLSYCIFLLLLFSNCNTPQATTATNPNSSNSIEAKTLGMEKMEGFFPTYWEAKTGKVWLEINRLNEEFLYVNSLAAGVGSNDIGLDRGQLGGERVVKFVRVGPKVLLLQPNYRYRAESDNVEEQKSVEEAFAQSVLWGFEVAVESGGRILVDATNFLMQDVHGVAETLKRREQGSYKIDASRSAIYLPRTKNFPQNTEFEATLTFVGSPTGGYIRSVTPSPEAVTVRQHHSFVQLPDDDYQPRKFDPRSGYFALSYYDYATPIDQPLQKQFIYRHRLQKKDPIASVSEALEPIVYYLDRGTPEPIRSALIEGASWWNEAFEAAGYKDAFRVEILPEDADPMDVRYNVIQWVHRSTRGWSYGGSVSDPRTGEIIKGHVSLGSLRVRQDFLIAQGLIAPYEEGKEVSKEMEQMALARLRQLSAHEVGHTLGLAHNFAASTNGRASVMDYPHPYITLTESGELDFSEAYDTGIGEWDKQAIVYGYQDFPEGVDELAQIMEETLDMDLGYMSDSDARPFGSAHPAAHLWDNGESAIEELKRMLEVRKVALQKFGENNIPLNTSMASLEEVLVPLYLSHRYQTEAVAKIVGGLDYTYAMRGDGQVPVQLLPAKLQKEALRSLLSLLDAEFLALPENILALIPPKPMGFYRTRESFNARTGVTFDPIAAAESAMNPVIELLLHPQRAARLVEYHARFDSLPSFEGVIEELFTATWKKNYRNGYHAEIGRVGDRVVLHHLLQLAANESIAGQVRAVALLKVNELEDWLQSQLRRSFDAADKAHYTLAIADIQRFREHPESFKVMKPVDMPDGSPIGCSH